MNQKNISYVDKEIIPKIKNNPVDKEIFENVNKEGNTTNIKQIVFEIIEENPDVYARIKKDDCIGVTDTSIEFFSASSLKISDTDNIAETNNKIHGIVKKSMQAIKEKGYYVGSLTMGRKRDEFDGIERSFLCFRCSSLVIEKEQTAQQEIPMVNQEVLEENVHERISGVNVLNPGYEE